MSYIGVQPTAGQYRQLDDISGSFNGATVTFTTSVGGLNVTAGSAEQLLVSLGGVIQNPGADYSVSTNSITFTTAPGSGLDFFAILMGDAVNVGTPADGSVTSVKLASDLTVDLASGTVSAPSLTFDANTGLYSPGADQVAVATNGVERVEFGTSEVVFNDGGEDIDFRIEGDTESNLFFVDAGNDSVSIGGDVTITDKIIHGGDTDTAIRFPAADVVAVETGGSERCRVDDSGRLLVGTSSSPGGEAAYSKFAVVGATNVSGATAHISLLRAQAATAPISAGEQLGLINFGDSGGNSFAIIQAQADGTSGSGDYPGRLVFSTTADGASSPTERMRITESGGIEHIAVGNAIITASVAAAGTVTSLIIGRYGATAGSQGSGTISFRVWTNGNVINTNNSYGAISDLKLKENIVDATSQWNDIKALQVRKYNFKEGQTHTQIGLVAQEVELVSPGLVTESPDRDEDGNDLGTVTKSVNYSVLYMKAVKALQEAMERIETLEAKVAALEAQ